MTPQERKIIEQARNALQTGLVWTEYAKDVVEIDDALTAVNELLAQQGRIEKQIGEIIKSLRCPNCESLERQNAELDLQLAEQDQPPFGFLTNKRQRFNFEPNATGLSNMPMTIDWKIPLYGAPQPQRKPLTDEQIINEADRFDWGKDCAVRFARVIEAAHGIKE